MQLADENIGRNVGDLLSGLDFTPRHLEIELTESMVMRDAAKGVRALNTFREIGTRLSIDDFGTGYSSLAYLKRLPIDTLKIDRSFITDTPEEGQANAIVEAIIAMGHSLGLHIIAEGVQEERQAAFLKKAHCDLLQGFHFSAAVAQRDFLQLIAKRDHDWIGSLWKA
jgi:EAL domain-containing protein (putative c-di-GMP-specific phosphodiesterase class I)